MKKIMLKGMLAAAFGAALLISCGGETKTADASATEQTKVAATENAQMAMNIEGMTCAVGCAKTIEHELKNTTGVTSAKVDFENKSANIAYDNTLISEKQLLAVVNDFKEGMYTAQAAN